MKAAPRDASWYNHPNVSSFKVVHADNGDEFAMCNTGMLLGVPVWNDAAEVPKNIRCGRAACVAAFAEADRTDRTIGPSELHKPDWSHWGLDHPEEEAGCSCGFNGTFEDCKADRTDRTNGNER